jgi:pyruvate dehydrogenase E1 component beta subunit
MKVVSPSNAYDAKGLMTAAIRDPNPVIYMFHKGLQGMGWLGTEAGAITHVPEESYEVEIGKAAIAREGRDLTIVSIAQGVHHALKAAAKLAEQGISAEVVDLRSLVPLDRETVRASVAKTGRLIVVDEDYHRECPELCVSGPVHAVSDTQASKRSPNIMANWLRAANHSLTFRPSFSKLRMAR